MKNVRIACVEVEGDHVTVGSIADNSEDYCPSEGGGVGFVSVEADGSDCVIYLDAAGLTRLAEAALKVARRAPVHT